MLDQYKHGIATIVGRQVGSILTWNCHYCGVAGCININIELPLLWDGKLDQYKHGIATIVGRQVASILT